MLISHSYYLNIFLFYLIFYLKEKDFRKKETKGKEKVEKKNRKVDFITCESENINSFIKMYNMNGKKKRNIHFRIIIRLYFLQRVFYVEIKLKFFYIQL